MYGLPSKTYIFLNDLAGNPKFYSHPILSCFLFCPYRVASEMYLKKLCEI